ncbi:hypothetical protein [Fibrobacter sp. UBA3629]|uniref:hypothetical protein n=1 Tax=Fibrobacter sp. UBA3629 TaxID=1946530 RepID=UPI0025C631A6|nr:hypothetical protein [Fibrobacter sp. UBA3629]
MKIILRRKHEIKVGETLAPIMQFKGNVGDCGPKSEYTKTVDHRRLRLYVKACDGSWLVPGEEFLFCVEYD